MHTTGLTWNDLNDGFVVAIHIEAKSGEAETVAALLADLVAPTMAEPGVKLFIPYRSPTSPAMFFVFEPFRSFRMQCRHDRFAPINRRFCALVYLSRSGRPSVSG